MIVLAIHTSGAEGSVAVARCERGNASTLAVRYLAGKTFSADMMVAVKSVLAEAQLMLRQVQQIAVAAGPGSFTGTRIGVATAKGLADGARLPLRMVSSLALLAMRLPQARAVLDAGRGEFYVGEYEGAAMLWERLMTREEMLAAPLSAGRGYVACEEAVAESLLQAEQTVLQVAEPDATTLARWVAANPQEEDVPGAWQARDANYLRRSDAEVKLRAAQ